jgi:hypothetical protein
VVTLLPGSPAIDAGTDDAVSSSRPHATDQTGAARVIGAAADIGAFESRALPGLVAPILLVGDSPTSASVVRFEADFDVPLAVPIDAELFELTGTLAPGATLSFAGDGNPLTVVASLPGAAPTSGTLGLRIEGTARSIHGDSASLGAVESAAYAFRNLPGDVNGDGVVDVFDVTLLANRLVGL